VYQIVFTNYKKIISQGFQSQFLLQLNKVHKNQLPFHIIVSSTETLGIIEMQDLHCAHSLSNRAKSSIILTYI